MSIPASCGSLLYLFLWLTNGSSPAAGGKHFQFIFRLLGMYRPTFKKQYSTHLVQSSLTLLLLSLQHWQHQASDFRAFIWVVQVFRISLPALPSPGSQCVSCFVSTPFQRNVSTPFQRTGLVTVLYAQPEHEGRAVVGKASVVQPHIPVLFVTEYLWQLAERGTLLPLSILAAWRWCHFGRPSWPGGSSGCAASAWVDNQRVHPL